MNKIIILISAMLISATAFAQLAPDTYLIKFKDKGDTALFDISKPETFLSKKAIERRKKFNIKITKQDLPVNQEYIKKLKSLGLEIYAVSKWLNAAVVFTKDTNLIKQAKELSFVNTSKFTPAKKVKQAEQTYTKPDIKAIIPDTTILDYGNGKTQATMLNTHFLHNNGYTGKGITIAVLDAGFYHVDTLPSFDSIRTNKQILGTRDFVERDGDVYKDDTHGMMVLSTIAGNIPGKLVGTAPDAEFYLFRTEDERSENIVEEYYWAAAAEYADSLGVDMIHTSLGYNDFDIKENNHKYEDMNGDVTPISIASDIASSKGILVVTSAGNEGNDPWKYISAPADADSTLAVGSVSYNRKLSYFSSRGPSSDGRVKPDVMAQGSYTYVQESNGTISFSFGTSFSGPVTAGAVACLWQANPDFNNMEIIDAVRKSCDRYDKPDGDFGFGIPDMSIADIYLKMKKAKKMKINEDK